MKIIKLVLLLISVIIILVSCSKKDLYIDESCPHNIVLSKDLLKLNKPNDNIFEEVHFTQLDTAKDAIYGQINSFKIINDTLYIFDSSYSKALYIFTIDGKFIRKLNKIGRGPGEYINPIDFDINEINGEISIFDLPSQKLSIYNNKCIFKREILFDTPFTSFTFMGDNIACLNSFPYKKGEYMLKYFDSKGKHTRNAIRNEKEIIISDHKFISRVGKNFYRHGSNLKFHISEKNIVYSLKNDSIFPFLSLNFSNDLIKSEEEYPLIYAYSENDNFAFFKTTVNNVPYDILYNFKTKEIFPLEISAMISLTKLPINLLGIWEDKLVGSINPQNIPYLKILADKGELQDSLLLKIANDPNSIGGSDILVTYNL